MSQSSPTHYTAHIVLVDAENAAVRPIFRYTVKNDESGEVVFSGHAGDLSEATDSAQAYIAYLRGDAAAA